MLNNIRILISDKSDNPGYSWTIYSKKFNFISQNSVSYFCHNILFDVDLKIMKDTTEGKSITRFLELSINPDSLKDYLLQIILKNISVEDFKIGLNEIKEDSYNQGIKDNQKQIRMALGIESE